MGHSVKLDDVYYDKDNAKSQQKILLEYMKAIVIWTCFILIFTYFFVEMIHEFR